METARTPSVKTSRRMRRPVYGLFAAITVVGLGLSYSRSASKAKPDTDATAQYLATLDPAKFERNGTRYTDPDLSPFRILPSLTPHDVTYHYDFARLAATEERLRGVDRALVLRALFQRITAGASTARDQHRAILRFLHKATFHNLIQPMYPSGEAVYDPLVLLELGEMRCGHGNRVAADLFRANGYPARLVQVAYHVLGEVWYDGAWHYYDADIFGNGETAELPDGRIPSFAELAECPDRLDALASFWEPDHRNAMAARGAWYPSRFYFAAEAYADSGVTPGYILKRATPEQEAASRFYGWELFDVVPDPDRRLQSGSGQRQTPAPPTITEVRVARRGDRQTVHIHWAPDPVAAGYRVFAGRTSRGWNYNGRSLPDELMSWKSSHAGWRPEMYEARYRLPTGDVGTVETTQPQVSLELPTGPVYVTVMPFDRYGDAIGRRLYPMSEELLIP